MFLKLTLSLFTFIILITCGANSDQCYGLKLWLQTLPKQSTFPICQKEVHPKTLYVIYDVNPPEGFNLRRDVYIRLAVFIRNLQYSKDFHNIRLILPPWRRLYHWKTPHMQQNHLAWSNFFDVNSLKRFAPVLDYPEFLQEIALYGTETPVYKVLQLQHYKDMFDNGVFYDKWEFADDCQKTSHILKGSFLEQAPLWVRESHIQCVRFQGSAKMLKNVLQKVMQDLDVHTTPKIVAILNAEVVLHDQWANQEFWQARRSMRFAQHLISISNKYRLEMLNSTDNTDNVQRPPMWEFESSSFKGKAVGGSYLAAHVRRADFLYGREKTAPTLKSIALQLKYYLKQLNLNTLFLATDASNYEVNDLKSYLSYIRVLRFKPESVEMQHLIKDGGIAIIDQLICAHARFFIGTYESTFTYRIYEEREILGFPQSTTFNTFCKKSTMEECSKNSAWPIVY